MSYIFIIILLILYRFNSLNIIPSIEKLMDLMSTLTWVLDIIQL